MLLPNYVSELQKQIAEDILYGSCTCSSVLTSFDGLLRERHSDLLGQVLEQKAGHVCKQLRVGQLLGQTHPELVVREEVVDAVQHELADGLEAGWVGGGEQGGVRVKGVLGQRDSQTGLLSRSSWGGCRRVQDKEQEDCQDR